ncbi:MarR family winged helix-turn-helix transcriptional regulator [Actinosynnema pretiosum]|uniref:MarR family transcriptional regulator n=1 Tax=Actinosynnema pretiosum TaxID=42197 RepID=A0A290Z8Y6_9PSEU|nr:MarR family transcriptional regulator [Actinosynnema pretiosum]ATE55442.1 MarR family transcriptional regulator [Actinosynnema pretiosum]
MPSEEAPKPLDVAEQRAWALLLGVTTWLPAALDAHLQKEAGISHSEYQVLWWLSASTEKVLHMSQLADSAGVTASHLSRIVARLEKRGWITRNTDPADGRYTQARLTGEGERKVAECAPGYATALRANLFDHLAGDQVDDLATLAYAILRELRPVCVNHLPGEPPA